MACSSDWITKPGQDATIQSTKITYMKKIGDKVTIEFVMPWGERTQTTLTVGKTDVYPYVNFDNKNFYIKIMCLDTWDAAIQIRVCFESIISMLVVSPTGTKTPCEQMYALVHNYNKYWLSPSEYKSLTNPPVTEISLAAFNKYPDGPKDITFAGVKITAKNTAPYCLPPDEFGKISCITTPSEADVYFNGHKQVNKTPVTLTGVVPNKWHTIKFIKEGFLEISDQYSVEADQTKVAEKILTPILQPGYINAISDLPDVTVKMLIEGKSYSYPAPHKFGTPAGRQVVFFSKPDHKQVEHSITVEPRQTVTLKGNPIPIVADTVLILNTLPSEVSEGDKITLSGTLQSKDGKPVVGQIHFYDKDTVTADDELFENNNPLVAMSSSSTGKYSATWTAKKVDSESVLKLGTSGAQIYAEFDGTSTHNKSKSTIRNITLKEIVKEGQLRITTRPPGADVYIDGEKQEIGTSAEKFSVIKKLPFGKYTIKTEIKGFDPMEEEVEIKEGPYETVVNHIYEGAKNLCGVLGLETTELGCIRAILTLPIDLYSPFADAYIIKEHKSLYTGKPETPTKFTYLCLVLGCIGLKPVALGAKGFKASAKGAKLAALAKIDSKIETIFMDENLLGKILSMTSSKVDELIDLVVNKNYDGIRTMLKDTEARLLPPSTLDEISENAATFVGKDKAADVTKILEDATKVAKVSFKLEKQGVNLFKMAITDKNLAKSLIDGRFLANAKNISDDTANLIIEFAKVKEYKKIYDMLIKVPNVVEWGKLSKEQYAAFYKTQDDVVFKLLKLVDPLGDHPIILRTLKQSAWLPYRDIKFIKQYFIDSYIYATKIEPQKLSRVATETIERITTDSITANTLAVELGIHFPKLLTKLRASPHIEANALAELLDSSRKIFTDLSDELTRSTIEEMINRIARVTYKSARTENISYIKNFMKLIIDETGKLKPIEDLSKIDLFKDIIKVIEVAPLFVKRFANLFSDVADGTISKISKTDADDFLLQIEIEPKSLFDLKKALLDKDINVNILLDKLSVLNTHESKSIRNVIKNSISANKLKVVDEVTSGTATTMKITLDKAPQYIDNAQEVLDETIALGNQAQKSGSTEIIEITDDLVIDLIDTLGDEIPTSSTFFRHLTLEPYKKWFKKFGAQAAKNPLWISWWGWEALQTMMFASLIYWKFTGDEPGSHKFAVNAKVETMESAYYGLDDVCDTDPDASRNLIEIWETALDELKIYVEKNKSALEGEQHYTTSMGKIDVWQALLIEHKKKCIPAEITIPESGIIEDVFVSKVIDGDTIECRKDDESFKIRIVGINTPDKGPAGYSAACSEFKDAETNTVWCSKDTYTESIKRLWDLTDDKVISLKVDPSFAQDTYGRYVALLMNKAGDEINLEMIKSGYACYYHREDFKETGLINHDEYIAARDTARDAKLGIWEPFELDVDIGYADFTTIPTGAQIYINNEYFSTTKKSNVSFKVGIYSVRFVKEGYHPCEQEFEIEKDEMTPVTCTLKEITEEEKELEGYALFRAFRKSSSGELFPIEADIWSDTYFMFRTSPSSSRAFSPGEHTITFKRHNYHNINAKFTILTGETITVDVTMDEIISEDPEPNTGLADFITIPTGAFYFVDDKYEGTTKDSGVKIELGSHIARFEKEGYESCSKEFEITNEKALVSCTLVESEPPEPDIVTGTVDFTTTPSGSFIYVDTKYIGKTSKSGVEVEIGPHVTKFEKEGYEACTKEFEITEKDEHIPISCTLTKIEEEPEIEDPEIPTEPHGTVDFISSPSVAKIFVSGNYIGLTKKLNYPLTPGLYTIDFEKDGYNPCTKTITVAVDEKVPCSCSLTKLEVEPELPSYPDAPIFPTMPTRYSAPPIPYEISPLPPATPPVEPEAEPWKEFEVPMKILFLNIGKEVAKQTTISTAGQKFMDKHCDLEFEWDSEDHDTVELGVDDDDCATLDDTEELTEVIEQDKVPEGTKIIYLLWNADEPKCVSYTGFTSGMDDLLSDAMLCSSPTSKSKPEFTATTGKLKNDNLKIKYEGSLTIIIQICEALHELYEKTKPDEAEELPEFDDEFCKKDITDDRPNAKCVVEWLSKFNDALPDEVKK